MGGEWLERRGEVVAKQGETMVRIAPECALLAAGTGACCGAAAAVEVPLGAFQWEVSPDRQSPWERSPDRESPRRPVTNPTGCAAPTASGVAPADLRLGETVTVTVPRERLTRVAAWLFGLPLVALLAGALLGGAGAGWLALPRDTAAAVTGLLCLAVAFAAGARAGAARFGALELMIRRDRIDS